MAARTRGVLQIAVSHFPFIKNGKNVLKIATKLRVLMWPAENSPIQLVLLNLNFNSQQNQN